MPSPARGQAMWADTATAYSVALSLVTPHSRTARAAARAAPMLQALFVPSAAQAEHDTPVGVAPGSQGVPLVEHSCASALATLLWSLESGAPLTQPTFAARAPITPAQATQLGDRVAQLGAAQLLPSLRFALAHLDVAKGGEAQVHARWQRRGVDRSIHNLASAQLLAQSWHRAPPAASLHQEWILALVRNHGLVGQALRGESPPRALDAVVEDLACVATRRPMNQRLRVAAHNVPSFAPQTTALLLTALTVIDFCDTAAVRRGLVDAAKWAEFTDVHRWMASQLKRAAPVSTCDVPETLTAGPIAAQPPLVTPMAAQPCPQTAQPSPPSTSAAEFASRFAKLRASRAASGESDADRQHALVRARDEAPARFWDALANAQLWYCEAALGLLSPLAHLKVLAATVGVAHRQGVPIACLWHANLQRLILPLAAAATFAGPLAVARAHYRRRLLETRLAPLSFAQLCEAPPRLAPLGALRGQIGGVSALWLELDEDDEAQALLTLLAIYEHKSAVAFHATLVALCDLYELRKDTFDRVANEANYLATMNAARSDKARMLDWVCPGTLIEIGPGGGVVLDLLAERFPTSTILGIDSSAEVIAALIARGQRDAAAWQVRKGDAFALPALVAPSTATTIIFCSVLHEIYSYVPWPRESPTGRPFALASITAMIAAAWACLAPGGRIVIRDGIAPSAETRRLAFVAADAYPTFLQFVAQFAGRPIRYTLLPDGRVELSAADAMEFLYTYTWGPASFPYEVREQYGVLPYAEYVALLVAAVGGPTHVRIPDIPPHAREYLQPGYVTGLAGKIRLTDETDREVALPNSNCLIVLEKLIPPC